MGGTALRGFNVIADESTANTATFEWVQMSNHTMNLMNAVGRDTWSNTYNAINRANQVGYSDLAESILSNDPETLAEFRAEASFIRALGYFHLVRGFGLAYCEENKDVPEMGVPLRLSMAFNRANSSIISDIGIISKSAHNDKISFLFSSTALLHSAP